MGGYRIFQEQVIFIAHDKIRLVVSLAHQEHNGAMKHILLAVTREGRATVALSAVFSLVYLFHFESEFCARLIADGNGLGK